MKIIHIISKLFRFNRTNWKVVALCFLAALVFWLFNALNKHHTTNVSFPIQFEFDQDRYVAVQIPNRVRLNVSGIGWDLLRRGVGLKLPALTIPLERPAEVKKIVGSTLPIVLSSQIGALQINYVVNDTLYLQIEPRDSHRFKLVTDVADVTFETGYGRISPVVILPDSVELEGPRSILHKLPDSIILILSRKNLDENLREEIEVSVPGKEWIKRNPPVVEVRFEVGEVEDIEWKLKFEVLNKLPSLRVEGMVDSVKCRIRIPKTEGRALLAQSSARAFVDMKGLQEGELFVVPKAEGLSPLTQVLSIDTIRLRLY